MVLMAAAPAVASAALSITNVNLARASGPPGAVLVGGINSSPISNSTVTVDRGSPVTNLGSIRYSYTPTPAVGASGCVTASNSNGAKTVNPPLPRAPGTYTISFQAFSNATCNSTASSAVVAGGAVIVTQPATNPVRALKCGLRVALVLDESASITAAQAVDVRNAANGFVGALSDTGSTVAIIAFATAARTGVKYTEVNPTTIGSTFTPFINNNPSSGHGYLNPPASVGTRNGTNWQGAFTQVSGLAGGLPDLVVFITDGDPNGTIQTSSFTTNLNGGVDIMNPSVTAANAVKQPGAPTAGSHVLAIGVGEALNNPAGVSRLSAVSGPKEFPTDTENFLEADYTTVVHFEDLEEKLAAIVAELCGGTLTIQKSVIGAGGQPVDASGWTFAATLTPPPDHAWLTPSSAGTDPTARVTTGADGRAVFHWKLKSAGNATLSVVQENSKPGFHFVSAFCKAVDAKGKVRKRLLRTTQPIDDGLIVPPMGHATCTVLNAQTVGHLTVIKRLDPSDDPGRFDLLVNGQPERVGVGNNGTTGRLAFPLGTYQVSERVNSASEADGITLADYSVTTTCVNQRTRHRVSGLGTQSDPVSVRIDSPTDDWVCTITNTSTRFGDLTVIKHLVPDTAPGAFDLLVNGTVEKAGARDGDRAELIHIPFGSYTVSEAIAAGQTVTLANFTINTTCIDQSTDPATVIIDQAGPTGSVTLSRQHSDIECTITNEHIPPPAVAHLTVVKQLVPSSDPGAFDLLVDGEAWAVGVGDGGRTPALELAPGSAKVSEQGVDGTNLDDYSISTTCKTEGGDTVAHGTGSGPVTVDLSANDNVVCTITNQRNAAPVVPEGGGESDVCLDFESGVPECGNVAAAPKLFVSKQMPAHARVGDRVQVTITVKNIGHATAHGVRLHEAPVRSGRIVVAANHGSIQDNGTVVWNLGSLPPGKTQTVHATLLVTATGLRRDFAVATAGNAGPAFDAAAVRARAAPAPPPPPAVTG
jgi:Domain of unknown function DUF11/von Willebrand factor type A domain